MIHSQKIKSNYYGIKSNDFSAINHACQLFGK